MHQRWVGATAMATILGTDEAVAAKDRLYRALDKALEHKEALETHLAKRWKDVEAHILVAFLGDCLWVCLKQKLKAAAASLTPAQVLHQLKQILLVEVWFGLRNSGWWPRPKRSSPRRRPEMRTSPSSSGSITTNTNRPNTTGE